jgi:hypothetical protein
MERGMSSTLNLRDRIFAKLDELQHLYNSGQIAQESNEYLDLVALREFQWILSFFEDAENPREEFSPSQTRH